MSAAADTSGSRHAPAGADAAVDAADKPLAGRTVVITRAARQADEFSQLLEAAGAEVLQFPVIKTVEPDDWGPADKAIRNLELYDWVVFTSVNGVRAFFDRMASHGTDARHLAGCRIAAVGPATAKRLENRGIRADFVADDHRAEGLIAGFDERGVGKGSRVLIPRALEAREILPDTLRERGAIVDIVPVYRTLLGEGDPATLARMAAGEVDYVTFSSASTVRNFLALIAGTPAQDVLDGAVAASVGPVTTDAARELGLDVAVEADPYTMRGLADAIVSHARRGA